MNKYTIYCTSQQTKKALKLGAPISTVKSRRTKDTVISDDVIEYDDATFTYIDCPTAEQMIGWLEEQGIHIKIDCEGSLNYVVQLQFIHSPKDLDVINKSYKGIIGHRGFPSRKEATLAAINTALEYLTNSKK